MKKNKTEEHQSEGNNLEEDQDVDTNFIRYDITAKTIVTIKGPIHFGELLLKCDDAYVAADPENHESDIQEARVVLENVLKVLKAFEDFSSNRVRQVKLKEIAKESPIEQIKGLAALVAVFERLDTKLSRALKIGDKDLEWQVICSTMKAKKEIKRILAEGKPLNVDDSLRLKLKKIRDDYGYTIDQVIEAFPPETRKSLSQELEEDFDPIDALWDKGTISYVDEGFFARKDEVGTLIVSQSLPENFVHHFENLRECYALGLFQATVIYCRAVIETGCFEALRRRGQVRLDSKNEDMREYCLKKLMQSIKPYVYRDNWDKADKVIKKADSILHSKRQKVIVTQPEAYDSIKDTFAIVEEIFSSGSHKNQRRR